MQYIGQIHNLKQYKRKRKYLRNSSTYAEIILWEHIKHSKLGYKFRRQHSIINYIVDFYCPKLKLIVELEGEVHNYQLQSQHDYIREQKLKALGFTIIQYKNEQILFETGKVLNHLRKVCEMLNTKNKDKDFKIRPISRSPPQTRRGQGW